MIVVAIIAGLLWRKWPALWIGLGILAAALLPVLGLTPFAFQRYSTVADRYMYLAMLGPALALADGLKRIKWPGITTLMIFPIAILAFAAFVRSDDWQDTDHLTQATLLVDSQSAAGNFIKASDFAQAGRWNESLPYYQIALKRLSDDGGVHFNYGNALMRCGKFSDAIAEFETALPLLDDDEKQSNDLANEALAYAGLKQFDRAMQLFRRSLQVNPENLQAKSNLDKLQSLHATTRK
jgi:tetratricopeptide (TPR) repeat protein